MPSVKLQKWNHSARSKVIRCKQKNASPWRDQMTFCRAGFIHGCGWNKEMCSHLPVTVGDDKNEEMEKLPETVYVYDARNKQTKDKAYVSTLKHGKKLSGIRTWIFIFISLLANKNGSSLSLDRNFRCTLPYFFCSRFSWEVTLYGKRKKEVEGSRVA